MRRNNFRGKVLLIFVLRIEKAFELKVSCWMKIFLSIHLVFPTIYLSYFFLKLILSMHPFPTIKEKVFHISHISFMFSLRTFPLVISCWKYHVFFTLLFIIFQFRRCLSFLYSPFPHTYFLLFDPISYLCCVLLFSHGNGWGCCFAVLSLFSRRCFCSRRRFHEI